MKKGLLFLLLFTPVLAFSQILFNGSTISITKTWSQEPSGYTYPMNIRVPMGSPPSGGFPVCILLHGNGGNGPGMIGANQNILACHALVAPTGYQNAWNICAENSDAPDVEMVEELVLTLQGYTNINPNQIRILGSSNGAALANRIFIENTNPGIDIICAIVSQLNEPQYHLGGFYQPDSLTTAGNPYCAYNRISTPITGRKYLSICNDNDSIIPYFGGSSVVGVDFLPAEEAAFTLAQHEGFTGSQISAGTPMGNPVVEEFAYLSGQVVHLKGNAAHGANSTQRDYITDFFADCNPITQILESQDTEVRIYPNPSHSALRIERGNGEAATLSVHGATGKLVLEREIRGREAELDLAELSDGIYLLRIDGRVRRFVKE